MDRYCTSCKSSEKPNVVERSSWLSAFLVIIIPKCPFCVMAYTSAITMCGGTDMYFTENNWVSYIPVLLGAVIIALLIANYRGARTIYALSIAALGLVLIMLTHQVIIEASYYTYGTILLILAIWMNGSLMSIISKIEKRLKRLQRVWQK